MGAQPPQMQHHQATPSYMQPPPGYYQPLVNNQYGTVPGPYPQQTNLQPQAMPQLDQYGYPVY
jgi:hypothetical protein